MAGLYVSPPEPVEVRVSPAAAIVLTLPLVELAPRFPGLEPWMGGLPRKLSARARADLRLLSVPLSGALAYLLESPPDEESAAPALEALREAEPDVLREHVLANLAQHAGLPDGGAVEELMTSAPDAVRQLIVHMEGPNPDESFPLDVDRGLELLVDGIALKAIAELRLSELWYDHFESRWKRALPEARRLADGVGRRIGTAEPIALLESIIGRNVEARIGPIADKRLVLCPIPFLGPYVSRAGSPTIAHAVDGDGAELGSGTGAGARTPYGQFDVLLDTVYVGFGLVRSEIPGGPLDPESAFRDLLAVLQALADEARLQAVAHIREHGTACAADFMQTFGWSQPATSRHLRTLESIGLLDVKRVDGVKWYTVSGERGRQVVEALERHLHPKGM